MTSTTPRPNPLHRTVFRVIAFAEAISWLGLLIGMFFKSVTHTSETGVKVFGPIHGTVLILYVLTCLWVHRGFRWTPRTLLLALGSSIPPFCTAVFEVLADRRGLLGAPAREPQDDLAPVA